MGARQKEWARRARAELLAALGGACVQCGESRARRLEFDHITPATWERNRLDTSGRISRYRAEAAAGLIQILCRRCNAKKGNRQLGLPTLTLANTTDPELCPF